MLVYFDMILIVFIFVLFVSISTGFMSLAERKQNAAFQYRLGPSLLMLGIVHPIFDGVKLIVKNIIWIQSFPILSFFFTIIGFFFLMISQFLIITFGLLSIPDQILYSVIIFIVFGELGTVILNVVAGLFFFSGSPYVLTSALRGLMLLIVNDMLTMLVLCIFGVVDSGSHWTFVNLISGQVYIQNIFIFGLYFFFIFLWVNTIESAHGPYEWREAESELITGLVNEMSGVLFAIAAIDEGAENLLSCVTIVILFFGGFLLSLKIIFIFLLITCFIKAIMPRIRISSGIYLIFFYLIAILFFYFVFFSVSRLIVIVL